MLTTAARLRAVEQGERAALMLLLEDLHRYADGIPPYPAQQNLADHKAVYTPLATHHQTLQQPAGLGQRGGCEAWQQPQPRVVVEAVITPLALALQNEHDQSEQAKQNAAAAEEVAASSHMSGRPPVDLAGTAACKCACASLSVVAGNTRCLNAPDTPARLMHNSPPRLGSVRVCRAPLACIARDEAAAAQVEGCASWQAGTRAHQIADSSSIGCHDGNIGQDSQKSTLPASGGPSVESGIPQTGHLGGNANARRILPHLPQLHSSVAAVHVHRRLAGSSVRARRCRSRSRKLKDLGSPDLETLLEWLAQHGIEVRPQDVMPRAALFSRSSGVNSAGLGWHLPPTCLFVDTRRVHLGCVHAP